MFDGCLTSQQHASVSHGWDLMGMVMIMRKSGDDYYNNNNGDSEHSV